IIKRFSNYESSTQGKNGKNTPCATETPAVTVLPVPVTRDKTGAVTVSVHAKPGAKHNAITGGCCERTVQRQVIEEQAGVR
uniref:Uncharacterized protein n=1 Tax=Gadus morhua TaxID=8049 RepID=A0A8C4ZJI9_GADMO